MVSLADGKMDLATCKTQMAQAKEELGEAKGKQLLACLAKIETKEGMGTCLAAVAPEELDEYVDKSKSAEAWMFVRKMSDGARTYYQVGALDLDAPIDVTDLSAIGTAKTLPDSVGPTPAKGACCKTDGKCLPEMTQWETPAWKALDFALRDPHYYSYEFTRGEDGKSFVASAYGDLDCDSEFSTFRIKGTLVGDGFELGELEKINPLE